MFEFYNLARTKNSLLNNAGKCSIQRFGLLSSLLRKQSQNSFADNRILMILVGFAIGCLIVSLFGLAGDPRLIMGERAWMKPCKFSISLAIYGLTLLFVSPYLTRDKAFFQRTCRAALGGTIVELLAVICQVVFGTTSPLNTATTFDYLLLAVTRIAIMPVAFSMIALFVMLLREDGLPPVLGLSLKWGVFLAIVGLIPGLLMILPDSAQHLLICCKRCHSPWTGLAGGGPGVPFLGWSTVSGDLRVAHFAGIHGLQVLPLVGILLDRLRSRLPLLKQRLLVWNAGLTYLGFIVLLAWQALYTESVIAPGLRTVAFSGGLICLSALAVACTLLFPNQRVPEVISARLVVNRR